VSRGYRSTRVVEAFAKELRSCPRATIAVA